MAVFRVERTGNFTVMSNHHLRDVTLSLKAKGLLSMMLSLPESWNYSIRGLAAICREGVSAVTSALQELEEAGYVVRRQLRDSRSGRIYDTEYVIYEQPRPAAPEADLPGTENPDVECPDAETPAQSNTEPSHTERENTDLFNIDSLPSVPAEPKGREMDCAQIRAWILENIDYDALWQRLDSSREELDELVELIVETVCARRKTIRIAGSEFPHEVVRSRFLKLNAIHVEFVLDCLKKNTTAVRNMKQYLLTALFNAPATMANYYTALVNHDLYEDAALPPGAGGASA